MSEERDELEGKTEDYQIGFTAGRLIAGVITSCVLAVIIVITLKIMKWIWLL